MKNKALFLDKDGVVCAVVYYGGKPCAPRTLEEFTLLPGAAEAVKKAKMLGFKVFICTNQPDISRGLMHPDVLDGMQKILRAELGIDDIAVCPHTDEHRCDCRKPLPGMLRALAGKWDIDLSASYMVGDTWKDMEAGRKAGVRTVLVSTGYNSDCRDRCDIVAADLSGAVETIARSDKRERGSGA